MWDYCTYLKGPAGSVLVVVADSLQLAASRKLPDNKLQAPPKTFTVEEHEELGHHSGWEKTGEIRLIQMLYLYFNKQHWLLVCDFL